METIALYGGTFDPPHVAHVEIIVTILEKRLADEVWVVPVRRNPFKPDTLTAPAVRRAMVQAAFQDVTGVRILYDEMDQEAPTFTVDTVRRFKRTMPFLNDKRLAFVVGSDSFRLKAEWKEIEMLEKELTFFVVPRLNDVIQYSSTIVTVPMARLDVSSSDIRLRVGQGGYIRHLVPSGVHTLITTNQLYV